MLYAAVMVKLDSRVSKEKKHCAGDTVTKRGAGRQHNYLYVH